MHPPWHNPFRPPVAPTRYPPVPLSLAARPRIYTPFSLSPSVHPKAQAEQERRGATACRRETRRGSRDDVELGLRPRRAARRRRGGHHRAAAAAAVDAARAASAPAPARAAPRPAPPCEEHRRGRRRRGGDRGGGGRLARPAASAAAAGAGAGGVAAAGVEARGGGRGRGGFLPGGRRFRGLGGEWRRGGAGAEPDRRRPGGAQGVRGSGLRLQLPRDPRAVRHAAGARALLLHEPALLAGRGAPAAWQQGGGGLGAGAGGGSGLARAARRHQLEDLQPWRQPGRGEGEAQVLGAGGGVHRQALQLIDQWRMAPPAILPTNLVQDEDEDERNTGHASAQLTGIGATTINEHRSIHIKMPGLCIAS